MTERKDVSAQDANASLINWLDHQIAEASAMQRSSFAANKSIQGERWHARQCAIYEVKIHIQSCGAQLNGHSGAVEIEKRAEQSNPGGGHEVTESTVMKHMDVEKPPRDEPTPAAGRLTPAGLDDLEIDASGAPHSGIPAMPSDRAFEAYKGAMDRKVAQLEHTIDILERNDRIQAKLLADTGRERDQALGLVESARAQAIEECAALMLKWRDDFAAAKSSTTYANVCQNAATAIRNIRSTPSTVGEPK